MADNTTPTPAETTPDAPPVVDDSKQWQALAEELETDKTAFEQEAPDAPAEAETKPAEPEPDAEPKTPPTYEQLQAQERNKTEALKWEREARRRAEESLTNVNKLIDDLRTARQQRQAPQPEQEPVKLPDVNEDPIGHFQAKVAMLEQALQHTYQGANQTAAQIHAERQEQQFWNHVQQAEAEYRKTTPTVTLEDGREVSDYDAACEHLKSHRVNELAALYPDDSPVAQQEARQFGLPSVGHLRASILQQDAIAIANRAYQLGVSPAQLYYDAAKNRGYTRPQASSKAKTNGAITAQQRAVQSFPVDQRRRGPQERQRREPERPGGIVHRRPRRSRQAMGAHAARRQAVRGNTDMAAVLMTATSFTRPADTTTYASGDLVANSTTAGSVVAMNFGVTPRLGHGLFINRVKVTKTAGPVANGTVRVHFFDDVAVAVTNGDNAAFAPTTSASYIGYLEAVFSSTLAGWGFATADSQRPVWSPAATGDILYGLVEARAAYVPTSRRSVDVPTRNHRSLTGHSSPRSGALTLSTRAAQGLICGTRHGGVKPTSSDRGR